MSFNFDAFANRLAKMERHTGKWARRQGISCYRIYDNDIPEFPLAVDRYETILHVSEYARNHEMEPDEHAAWLQGCIETLSETLQVDKSLIFLKFRQRQKGLQQYERFARKADEFIVREDGLKFIINPADYLDIGLFLDHRNTRKMVRGWSDGKRVLNLFAYTGSFTVHAAAGGAVSSLTIDMSNTYLQWALRNLSINGLDNNQHRFLQADVLQWLESPGNEQFDLIVCDPPTFSNSKRMDSTLDIQRDHVMMLNRILPRLAKGGSLVFSTNYRKFKLAQHEIRASSITDISKQTVPEDFRNKRIHQCFLLKK
ncbi:MAG: class I SAM-dependent methyltransferase [Lewinellaceae bacterium]|nr:class I SAM-dependent methyltransferase [Lewinellaceae bacterium]